MPALLEKSCYILIAAMYTKWGAVFNKMPKTPKSSSKMCEKILDRLFHHSAYMYCWILISYIKETYRIYFKLNVSSVQSHR